VLQEISSLPALVFAGETRTLKRQLADAVQGKAFVLQCGDCAEDFARCTGPRIHALIKVILQMSVVLAYAGGKRVINIGRLAGQYAKPRSSNVETIAGSELPTYRGDMVNSVEPTLQARTPDPRRMLEGYFRATATLNLVRAFTSGGYASLDMVDAWHRDFLDIYPANPKYEQLVKEIRKAVNFSSAIGIDVHSPQAHQIVLYTSHEALLLGYEQAMTRVDTTTGDWYDTSAHMLWIGDRTRQVDGAHVEFLRGVGNPIGVKVGPKHHIDEIKRVVQKIDPSNTPGKIALITRFGARGVNALLPPLVREMTREGLHVVWLCDPMHGNTYINDMSLKTRRMEDILAETRSFFEIHDSERTVAGGIHLELTGDDVAECVGGRCKLHAADLLSNYQTTCDPRLNAQQAVELAFELADILSGQRPAP
jgi:3-deoxy-7-phosphoheptulonate synthase